MGFWFVCPGCYKILDIDDFGNSRPTAKVKLVDGNRCGNCGRDLTSSYQEAMQFMSVQQKRKQAKSDE